MKRPYRADIEGLRAIAVVSVVAYHAHISQFGGGFVGVDIFFVISGFLITGIIQADVIASKFSIVEFYKRRIHRIFPALFAMLIIVSAGVTFVLLPSELMSYARSLISSVLSVSNLQFFSEAGYFDASASTKPLLHTWSLAVEEQFYIFWPIILVFAHKMKISSNLFCFFLGAVSLILSIWFIAVNPSAAFYLIPSRAWELMMGGFLSLNVDKIKMPSWAINFVSVLGAVFIIFSIKYYSSQTPFPGAAALVPCVGTTLLLYSGSNEISVVSRALGWGPMRRVGLFSYSIYLWHWPIIVFFQNGLYWQLNWLNQFFILLLSFLFGAISFFLIEEPFRRLRPKAPNWMSFTTAGAAILCGCMAGLWMISLDGLSYRLTPAQRQIASYLNYDGNGLYRGGKCFMTGQIGERFDAADCLDTQHNQPSLLLLGDSHAADLWPGFAAEDRTHYIMQATFAGCKPLISTPGTHECRQLMDWIFRDFLQVHHPDIVLVSARWRKGDLPLLIPTLEYLKRHAARVILVGPSPEYQPSLPRLLVTASRIKDPDFPAQHQLSELVNLDEPMRQAAEDAGVDYISLRSLLCAPTCQTLAEPTTPMYFDYGHFTLGGSKIVANKILLRLQS